MIQTNDDFQYFFFRVESQSYLLDNKSVQSDFLQQIQPIFKQPLPNWQPKSLPAFLKEQNGKKNENKNVLSQKMPMFKSMFQLQKAMRKLSKKSDLNKTNNLQKIDKKLILYIVMRFSQINSIQEFFKLSQVHYKQISQILNIGEELIYNQISQLFIEAMLDRPFSDEENAQLKQVIEEYLENDQEVDWYMVCYKFNMKNQYQGICRSIKQLKHQYFNKLDNNLIQNREWSLSEDIKLLKLSCQYSKSWSKVNKDFSNSRNQTQIKNRYQSLLNTYLKQNGLELKRSEDLNYQKEFNIVNNMIQEMESNLISGDYQNQKPVKSIKQLCKSNQQQNFQQKSKNVNQNNWSTLKDLDQQKQISIEQEQFVNYNQQNEQKQSQQSKNLVQQNQQQTLIDSSIQFSFVFPQENKCNVKQQKQNQENFQYQQVAASLILDESVNNNVQNSQGIDPMWIQFQQFRIQNNQNKQSLLLEQFEQNSNINKYQQQQQINQSQQFNNGDNISFMNLSKNFQNYQSNNNIQVSQDDSQIYQQYLQFIQNKTFTNLESIDLEKNISGLGLNYQQQISQQQQNINQPPNLLEFQKKRNSEENLLQEEVKINNNVKQQKEQQQMGEIEKIDENNFQSWRITKAESKTRGVNEIQKVQNLQDQKNKLFFNDKLGKFVKIDSLLQQQQLRETKQQQKNSISQQIKSQQQKVDSNTKNKSMGYQQNQIQQQKNFYQNTMIDYQNQNMVVKDTQMEQIEDELEELQQQKSLFRNQMMDYNSDSNNSHSNNTFAYYFLGGEQLDQNQKQL